MIFFVHIEGFPRKCCVSSLIFLVLLWLFTLSLTKWIVEIGVLFPTFMSFTIEIDWIKTDNIDTAHIYIPHVAISYFLGFVIFSYLCRIVSLSRILVHYS